MSVRSVRRIDHLRGLTTFEKNSASALRIGIVFFEATSLWHDFWRGIFT